MRYGNYQELSKKKGVAGLNVLLSVIAMLFMIGIIVMVFVIAGAKLMESVSDDASGSVTNETVTSMSATGQNLSAYVYRDCSATLTSAWNSTSEEAILDLANLTTWNCEINVSGLGGAWVGADINVSYTYTYSSNPEAIDSIFATYTSIDDVVDWFPTFIVLTAMVVLILLVVIIITSIRASGITEGA